MTSKFKLALLAAVAAAAVAAPASARPGRDDDGTEVRGRGADDSVADRRGRGRDDVNDAPDDSDGRTGGGHGADYGTPGMPHQVYFFGAESFYEEARKLQHILHVAFHGNGGKGNACLAAPSSRW